MTSTSHLSHLGSAVELLDAGERLRVLHDFYRSGEESQFQFDLKANQKLGRDFKDAICPDSMEFKKDHFVMGNKYGRVLFLKEYAATSKIHDQRVDGTKPDAHAVHRCDPRPHGRGGA